MLKKPELHAIALGSTCKLCKHYVFRFATNQRSFAATAPMNSLFLLSHVHKEISWSKNSFLAYCLECIDLRCFLFFVGHVHFVCIVKPSLLEPPWTSHLLSCNLNKVVTLINTRQYPTKVRIVMFMIGLEGHGWLIWDCWFHSPSQCRQANWLLW